MNKGFIFVVAFLLVGIGFVSAYNGDFCNSTHSPCGGGCTSTDLSGMYSAFTDWSSVGVISGWNTSCVTNMDGLFYLSNFNQDISSWDVSHVTSMIDMFNGDSSFNQPLNNWNTGSVTHMIDMFFGASSFNQNVGSWNVSSLTHAYNMFNGSGLSTSNYDSLLNGWSVQVLQSNVLFGVGSTKYSSSAGASRLLLLANGWIISDGGSTTPPNIVFESDTTNSGSYNGSSIIVDVTATAVSNDSGNRLLNLTLFLFDSNNTLVSASPFSVVNGSTYLNGFNNFSGLASGTYHFYGTVWDYSLVSASTSTRIVTLGNATPPVNNTCSFCTGSCSPCGGGCTATDLSNMYNGYNFTSDNLSVGDISGWNTSCITSMRGLFMGSNFAQNIGSWDTSSVTDMSYMFDGDSAFNSRIGTWYYIQYVGWRSPLDTSKVTDMSYMFAGASSFNQDLFWDTSKVTDMTRMFSGASSFNRDLTSWNISSLTSANNMFSGANLSILNYDALLYNWASIQPVHSNIVFSGGYSMYSVDGEVSRNILTNSFGWSITDGGLSSDKWYKLRNAGNYGINSLLDMDTNSDGSLVIISADSDGVYVSTNGGLNWSKSWDTSAFGVASSSSGSKLAFVGGCTNGCSDYIYTSSDYGTTWTQRPNAGLRIWSDIAMSSDGSKLIASVGHALGYSGYIYTSNDSGVTWVERTGAGSRKWYGVASSSDGSHLVAVDGGGNGAIYGTGYIYTSSDYGNSWTQRTGAGALSWYGVASSSDGSHLVAVAGYPNAGVWVSSNYGASWTLRTDSGVDSMKWQSVDCDSTCSHIILGSFFNSVGLYTSDDFGVTFTSHDTVLGSSNWGGVATTSDGSKFFAGHGGNTQTSTYVFGWAYSTSNDYTAIPFCSVCNSTCTPCSGGVDGLCVATNLSNMYLGYNFTSDPSHVGDISGWNTSCISDMNSMFAGSNFNQPIGSWDTHNVVSMSNMFFNDFVFNQNLSSWNVCAVTDLFNINFESQMNSSFIPSNSSCVAPSCSPVWITSFGSCSGFSKLKFYVDSSNCGVNTSLPSDNGTLVPCGTVCTPSWVASFSPVECSFGYRLKSYSDSHFCNSTVGLPVDNGTSPYCNIFSFVNTSVSPKIFENFTVLVGASVNTSNVSVALFYPNSSVSYFSPVWNGLSFESIPIMAFPNGSYSVVAFAGNQSIASNFTVYDSEAVLPSSFNSIVHAGDSYSFDLEIYTGSTLNLSHDISCSVPDGFVCSVVSNVGVVDYANVTVTISSNSSLASGSYLGVLNVTRLIDGRSFSSVLNLGVSSEFGVAQILNPSSFVQILYSNGVLSKDYTVKNVGNYNLSSCFVVVDGSFVGQSFVSGSPNNFSLVPNESRVVSVSYTRPSPSVYTGYFSVLCVASPEGLVNGVSNPVLQQLFVLPYVSPSIPSNPAGGGGAPPTVIVYGNVSSQSFVLLNKDGSINGYVSYSYPKDVFSKTFIVESKTADTLGLSASCRGDFCSYVKLSKSSFSLAGFGTDFFSVSVNVPAGVDLNGVYSYEIVLSDSSSKSSSLLNQVHISSLSAWYSKFSPFVKDGDLGFWFSYNGINFPKLLLYLLVVLFVDVATVFLLPSDKFYKSNMVLILTFVSLIIFGLMALIF